MVRSPRPGPASWAFVCGLAALLAPLAAQARQNGTAAQGCSGCHAGGGTPTITVTTTPEVITPGQLVTVNVSITPTNGPAAGLYLESSTGTLSILAGDGTKLAGLGVTHSAPKRGTGGPVVFHIGWTAPAAPGGVDFNVWGVSANGDGSSRGDGGGVGYLSVAYGCSGTVFYRDYDGDGYGGVLSGYSRACSKPMYFAAVMGDCNDNDERIHPGAAEACNKRDDNCDGRVDEGLPIVTYYTDADGDGHGVAGKQTVMDCAAPTGFGVGTDDCDDTKSFVYTGATELSNYIDDNCNGRVDEDARLACGTGWCRRLGAGCGTDLCTPGQPRAEVCNAFDDDCDGVNDNGTSEALCGGPGLVCVNGTCLEAGRVPDGGAAGAAGATGAGGAGPGAGGGSSQDRGTGCAVGGSTGGCRPLSGLALALALAAGRRRRRSPPPTPADTPS